jgi:DNA-binding transcriptional LysR family regulator
MNTTQLTYFKYVVDEMSVTKAAQKLFVSQSAVSQQISLLATELECQLFYRRGRSLELTPDGEFLYQKAKNIITQMEGLGDELKSRGANVVGTVKIGSGPVMSKKLLPDLVSNMLRTYPDISFSLFEIHSKYLVKSIAESQIDLGVGQIDEDDVRIHSEKLMTGRYVLICSSQSKWSSLQAVSLRDLPKNKLIRRVKEVEGDYFNKILTSAPDMNFQLEAMNTETIVPYVQLDMGIALAPDYIIDLMAPEGITQIELNEEISISWGVMWDRFRPLSKAAQVFIDMLKQKSQK